MPARPDEDTVRAHLLPLRPTPHRRRPGTAVAALALVWAAIAAPTVATCDRAIAAGSGPIDATLLTTNPFVEIGSTVGRGNDLVGGGCLSGGFDTSEDAWYRVDLPTLASFDAWITCAAQGGPSDFDTRLVVLDQALGVVACNDDAPDCGQPYYQSRLDDVLLAAGTYYLVVDGYNGESGAFELHAQWTLDPTVCEGSDATTATVIGALPFVDGATTVDACNDVDVHCDATSGPTGPDRWYRLDLDRAVLLDVSTACNATDLDTRVAVLDEQSQILHCNDDDPNCTSGASRLDDAFLEAGRYYVVIDGGDATAGAYTVSIDTTHAPTGLVRDLLCDLVVVPSDLYDHDVVTDVVPGRTHLRLSNATANLGEGALELFGAVPTSGDVQEVRQRVFRSDGSWYDRSAGTFVHHAQHDHIHVEDWAQYNLRERLPDGGVGAVLASGVKTSFCVIDLRVQDAGLDGFVPSGAYFDCDSSVQGLSVGWADVYGKTLPDQWIDVTGIADGTYWLESIVDPADHVLESDETNNVARVLITLGAPAGIAPDDFEPNDTSAEVLARAIGQNNSPNLGPCAPTRTIAGLTLHEGDAEDRYRFYLPAVGASDDEVRVDFVHVQGDVDLQLLDASGAVVASSTTTRDFEAISLTGRPAGWYTVRVYGFQGATSPGYALTVDPSQNAAPSVVVVDPPLGDTRIVQALQTHPIRWNASDPESGPTWATVFVNTTPVLDGAEILLETSLHTPGELGEHVLNSAYLPVGTWWVYVRLTDGGSVVGAWSSGSLTLVDQSLVAAPPATRAALRLAAVPNPFNPATTLELEVPRTTEVVWTIHDARGARVRTLAHGRFDVGLHRLEWNGRDDRGARVASGVYHVLVRAGDASISRKVVLIE